MIKLDLSHLTVRDWISVVTWCDDTFERTFQWGEYWVELTDQQATLFCLRWA